GAMARRRSASVVPLLVLALSTSVRAADAQEPPAPPEPSTQETELVTSPPTPASPSAPLSGWYNGTFFLRDQEDNFRLYVQGRVHVDYSSFYGPGVQELPAANALKQGFFLRRVRLELAGELFQHWQWMLSGELSSGNATDNVAAQNATPSCGYNASGVETCADNTSPVEAATVKPIPTDAFVNYVATPAFNVQVGQYLLPFTFENRISDNTTPFIERSVPVRNLAAPTQRDIGAMVWGDLFSGLLGYSVGVYNGDGPNRPNQDSRFDFYGRVVAHPFPKADDGLKWVQVGLSGRAGTRDPSQVGYDLPSLTTQAGYAFWKPTYKDSLGRLTHILPSAWQQAAAADILVPLDRFDFTAEGVIANFQTREAIDGAQLSPYTQRTGAFNAFGTYVQVGAWLIGDRSIIGFPGTGKPLHIDFSKPSFGPTHGLELLAKWEHLEVNYDSASRSGVADKKLPATTKETQLDTFSLGLNYWATKHVRVSANYVLNDFPNQSATASLGHWLHEVSARVGVQF
ncbi:MAG TPA: porin, partial [Polyangiaceae bacterium]